MNPVEGPTNLLPGQVGAKPDVMIKDAPEKEEKGEDIIEEIIEDAKKRYALALEADKENRDRAQSDMKFLAGDQWPEEAKTARMGKRLMLVLNYMPGFVSNITGDIRQNKPSIKCRPANNTATAENAKKMDGIVRHIEYISQAENAYIGAADSAASCGIGAWRVNNEYVSDDSFDRECKIVPIENPMSVVVDQLSVRSDGSDARFMFVVEQMDRDEFDKRYPGKNGSASFSDPIGTKEEGKKYEEPRQVVEYWRKEEGPEEILLLLTNGESVFKKDLTDTQRAQYAVMGVYPSKSRKTRREKIVWMRLSGDECVEGPIEWEGSYIPIILLYGKLVFADGKKSYYSAIHWAKDANMIVNFTKTTQIETIALQSKAPNILTAEQIRGYEDKWANANNDTLPYLLYNPDPLAPGAPKRSEPPQGSQALFTEAQTAKDEMKALTGIFDPSTGRASIETSGRAILARQQQGALANFSIKDNLRRAVEQTGRVLIDLVPEVYGNRQYLRILGDDGKTDIVRMQGDQRFDLSMGKYDAVATMGPSYASTRLESQDLMREMLQAVPAIGPMVIDLVVEKMDVPDAEAIAERLRKLNPATAPIFQPQPQQQQQMFPPGAGHGDPQVAALTPQELAMSRIAQ